MATEFKPGDRVYVTDPALAELRHIMRSHGHTPTANHIGTVESSFEDTEDLPERLRAAARHPEGFDLGTHKRALTEVPGMLARVDAAFRNDAKTAELNALYEIYRWAARLAGDFRAETPQETGDE